MAKIKKNVEKKAVTTPAKPVSSKPFVPVRPPLPKKEDIVVKKPEAPKTEPPKSNLVKPYYIPEYLWNKWTEEEKKAHI